MSLGISPPLYEMPAESSLPAPRTQPTRKYHHYRPALHLRRFAAADEKVWVYDRAGAFPPVQQNIKTTGGEKYLYAPEEDRKDDQIEVWLSDNIDGPAAAPLERLIAGKTLVAEDRSLVAVYLGLQDMRTPKVRDILVPAFRAEIEREWAEMTRDRSKVRQEILNATGVGYSYEELEHLIGSHNVEVNTGFWLDFLTRNANVAGKRLFDMEWRLVDAPEPYTYLTNDVGIAKFRGSVGNPVPFAIGFDKGITHWVVPLSPHAALVLSPRTGNRLADPVEARATWAKALNRRLVLDAHRFVYSRWFAPYVEKWWRTAPPAA